MRPLLLIRFFVLLAAFALAALQAQASHLLGAELSYEYAGSNSNPFQYRVTARLYHDSFSSVLPESQLTLTCGLNECGNTLPGSFTATLVSTGLQPEPAGCNSPRYRVNDLSGLVQLRPGQWTLSIDGINRSPNLVNMSQSGNTTAYVKATLDNRASGNLVNSSPQFTTPRLIQLNGNLAQRYSTNAFDRDGDSLVYQLVMPLTSPTSAAPCGQATSGVIAPHFQLNAATGELLTRTVPTQLGNYALAVQVDEYRRTGGSWQQIGSIVRDVVYTSIVVPNQMPVFTRVADTRTPTGQLLGQTIRVNPGQTAALVLTATDPDAGQQVGFFSAIDTAVPGATLVSQANGQAMVTWQVPATLPVGRYYFAVAAYDSNCPRGGTVLTLPFLVTRELLGTSRPQPLQQLPYPNPFTAAVQLQFASLGTTPVTIEDYLGRTVARLLTDAAGHVQWRPAPTLPAGLYLARNLRTAQVARLQYSGQ